MTCGFGSRSTRIWIIRMNAYQRTPRLSAGDGPIGKYRKWAEQFYPAEK